MKTLSTLFIALIFIGCSSHSKDTADSTEEPVDISAFISSFDYKPEEPQNGSLLGIIEIGYEGFKYYIVNIDKQDRWSLERSVYERSHLEDPNFSFERMLASINRYKLDMIEFGVRETDINLVASASAMRHERVAEMASYLSARNIGLIRLNEKLEDRYALFATIPSEYVETAFMIDIGQEKTKVLWASNDEIVSKSTYGSKYYVDRVPDSVVYGDLQQIIDEVPLQNRNVCFVLGGIPSKLASMSNNRDGRYTVLTDPRHYRMNDEHGLAGLNLYRAAWSEETFSYVFDWDASFSIGILMDVN